MVVDAFALPQDAYRGRLNMIYAAVTDAATVKKLAGINRERWSLATISIQELAMVQACCQDPQMQQGGTALLQIEDNAGAIFLIEGGNLYLSRALDLTARESFAARDNLAFKEGATQQSQELEQKAEKLALDVQRSLDYYESQIGKAAPARVAWVNSNTMSATLADLLRERLSVSVMPLELTALAQWKQLPDDHEHLCWSIACGAALQGVAADAEN
jgi:MSHA biogenesis protein MshI